MRKSNPFLFTTVTSCTCGAGGGAGGSLGGSFGGGGYANLAEVSNVTAIAGAGVGSDGSVSLSWAP